MADQDPLFRYTWPQFERLKAVVRALIFRVAFTWMGVLAALQVWLLPHWTPPDRFALASALVAPLAAWVAWDTYARKFHAITLLPDRVELVRTGDTVIIPRGDVLGLLGESGLNLDGGELIVMQSVRMVTEAGDYSLSFGHLDNEELFPILRAYCPHAWALPFPGDLEPPEPSAPAARARTSDLVLGRFVQVYRRQLVTSLGLGAVLVVGGLGFLGAVLLFATVKPDMSRGLVWLVVLIVAGFVLSGHSVRNVRMMSRIEKARRGVHGFD